MFRVSKLTDYGFLILSQLTRTQGAAQTSKSLASSLGLQQPTTAKILKMLNGRNLVESVRGCNGGYVISRPANMISILEVIDCIEGPLGITKCTATDAENCCNITRNCSLKPKWQNINNFFVDILSKITLNDLMHDISSKINEFKK